MDNVPIWCSHDWKECGWGEGTDYFCSRCDSLWFYKETEPKKLIGYIDGSLLARKEEPS